MHIMTISGSKHQPKVNDHPEEFNRLGLVNFEEVVAQ